MRPLAQQSWLLEYRPSLQLLGLDIKMDVRRARRLMDPLLCSFCCRRLLVVTESLELTHDNVRHSLVLCNLLQRFKALVVGIHDASLETACHGRSLGVCLGHRLGSGVVCYWQYLRLWLLHLSNTTHQQLSPALGTRFWKVLLNFLPLVLVGHLDEKRW